MLWMLVKGRFLKAIFTVSGFFSSIWSRSDSASRRLPSAPRREMKPLPSFSFTAPAMFET